MKKFVLLTVLAAGSITLAFAWGAWGHQHINRASVFALPDEMRPFFYNHIAFVTEEAVVPDLRKYTINDKAEFPRHFIDLELFGDGPVSGLPQTMAEAKSRYADSFLNEAGILLWYIQEVEEKLTKAFKAKAKTEILFLAADLGHYIGDAHMPLHTALNHNGQLTGQKGIHGFWEGQLPEMFGDKYNLNAGPARYIDNITRETWLMVDSTHQLAESLLAADRQLAAGLPKDNIYVLDSSGNIATNRFGDLIHSRAYAIKYHARLNGMIERQLRRAILETASFWYTAWVNAGKPDLSELDPASLTARNKKFLARDLREWKQGRVDMVRPAMEYPQLVVSADHKRRTGYPREGGHVAR
jgi:hypothetical protein